MGKWKYPLLLNLPTRHTVLTLYATEILQEGLQFNFLKLYDAGKINKALVEIIRSNVRLPESTIGDMHAGVAAARVGARRVLDLVEKYGRGPLLLAMNELLDYGERMTRLELAKLPSGHLLLHRPGDGSTMHIQGSNQSGNSGKWWLGCFAGCRALRIF